MKKKSAPVRKSDDSSKRRKATTVRKGATTPESHKASTVSGGRKASKKSKYADRDFYIPPERKDEVDGRWQAKTAADLVTKPNDGASSNAPRGSNGDKAQLEQPGEWTLDWCGGYLEKNIVSLRVDTWNGEQQTIRGVKSITFINEGELPF